MDNFQQDLNLVKSFETQGGDTGGVKSTKGAGAAIKAAFSDSGSKKIFGPLRDFKSDQRPYLYSLMVLKLASGGLDFDTRSGDFYDSVVNHFNGNVPSIAQEMNMFAVNAGIPDGGQLKSLIDLPLTDISRGYYNKNWIGNMILTDSPVLYQTGSLGKYGNEQNNAPDQKDILAEGAGNIQQVGRPQTGFDNYFVKTYALMDMITSNDLRNYMRPFDAESDLVIMIKTLLMLVCEIDIQAQLNNTSGYPTDSVIALASDTARFSDFESSSVKTQAAALRTAIRTACGMEPNTLVMDANVFDYVSRHPDVLGTIFTTMSTGRTASEEDVKKVFQVDKLLIGRTARTTSDASNADLARVWGKNIWMGYVSPTKMLREQNFGYYHHYANADSYVVARQSIGNPLNKDIFTYMSWQHHITDKRCGGLITGAIA